PSQADAHDGHVVVDGPDGVAVTLTADAALETSEHIDGAAVKAKGQEQMKAVSGVDGTEILEREKEGKR
ncbi:MAG: hypothetical protein JF564_05215, partial [Sphingomonas sp.]|nr:hypothetical protein [Sphingomonas sp.]